MLTASAKCKLLTKSLMNLICRRPRQTILEVIAMANRDELIAYTKKKVLPVLAKSNCILRDVFHSSVSVAFKEPTFSHSYREVLVWIYPQGNAEKKLGCFHLTRGYRWWLRLCFVERWGWIIFRAKTQQIQKDRGFLPLALASYAYVWSNFLTSLEGIFHPCNVGVFNPSFHCDDELSWSLYFVLFSDNDLSASIKFNPDGLSLKASWGKCSLERFVPYGDQYLAEVAHNFAKFLQLNQI